MYAVTVRDINLLFAGKWTCLLAELSRMYRKVCACASGSSVALLTLEKVGIYRRRDGEQFYLQSRESVTL